MAQADIAGQARRGSLRRPRRGPWRTAGLALLAALAVLSAASVETGVATAATTKPQSLSPGYTTLLSAAQSINAPAMWNAGYTGAGVDVAIIDTGVSPVVGLDGARKLYHGADLSFESQSANLRHKDTYGHGTHMAGIIGGKQIGWTPATAGQYWAGIAPDSSLMSVKVAEQSGAVDVSQVIAGIYWVIQHRYDNGLNIRVINLSFGTDALSVPWTDPLDFAAETAAKAGIAVVVSAGNTGYGTAELNNPAQNHWVIAVGATDTKGTATRTDDVYAPFSTATSGARNADVYAPGTSIASLNSQGSYIDLTYPGARVGDGQFLRGSGSSQAAAVVSGAMALLFGKYPQATPYQILRLLTPECPAGMIGCAAGNTVIDLAAAMKKPLGATTSASFVNGTGKAALDISRGSSKLVFNGVTLSGEKDIFGRAFSSATISAAGKANAAWSGGSFNGAVWTGTTWTGNTYATAPWTNKNWAGVSWSTIPQGTSTWNGIRWSGDGWSGIRWSGIRWSGQQWSSAGWK